MKQILKKISLLAIVLGTAESFAAPCDGLNISAQPALVNFPAEQGLPQTISVSRSTTSGSCSFMVFIQNNTGAYTSRVLTKGNLTIPIQFYNQSGQVASNIIRSASEATASSHAVTGTIANGSSTANVYYYAYVDSSVSASAGPYIDRYFFQLYSWNGSNFSGRVSVTTNASTNYKYLVDDSMSLSLVNDGSLYNAADTTQTLDFGSLTTGESLGFDLWLVYTNGYKLSLISTNNGNLRNSAVTTSNLVPYTLALDNVNVALSSAETVVKTGTGASPAGGTKVDVTATIGNVGTVYAGTYNDYVTFRIAAP